MQSKSQLVRSTTQWVMQQSKSVKINYDKLNDITLLIEQNQKKYLEFDSYDCHLSNQSPETQLEYIFALDTLNFCFWPQQGYEYDNLAGSLKKLVLLNKYALKPENLVKLTQDDVKNQIFEGNDFPLLEERYRLLQETGAITLKYFDGSYAKLIQQANKSCQNLLFLLTSYFNGFQDHAIYKGRQVFFYKRSQILIGDIFAAFKGQGFGEFTDIDDLTMFPDYRVPQILKEKQVIEYSESLRNKIISLEEVTHGSEEEIEIRSASVQVVEQLKKNLGLKSIEVDWILWQMGEEIKENIFPHHRTLSIYY